MVTGYQANPVVEAVIKVLADGGLVVGDGEKPDGAGWQGPAATSNFVPYVVVHPFAKAFDGTIEDPFVDGAPTLSLNAFGATSEQARRVSDKAFTLLTTITPTITGRHVMIVEPLDDGATDRFDDVQPPIWQDVQRVRIHTTPG